jgi:uncharacterized Fe-S center protein
MINKPFVYFLKPDQWRNIPEVLDKAGIGSIVLEHNLTAIKIHFGEKGNKGYIKPELIKPVIKKIKELGAFPFVTDANTIYRGERTDSVHHLMLAAEHGFHPKFLGAPVVIADGLRGNSYVEVDITNGRRTLVRDESSRLPQHFKTLKIAEAIYYADAIVAISHFKGHDTCGIGGAIKNLGMGCAARPGKYEQHNSVVPEVNAALCTACGACIKWCSGGALALSPATITLDPSKCIGCGQCILACNHKVFSLPWNEKTKAVQEKVAEYACGAIKGKKAIFINFLTFITKHCDCFKTTTKPILPDIGILISTDPVAIDKASLDLITKHAGRDILKETTGADGTPQIEYAEKLGLGTQKYQLL